MRERILMDIGHSVIVIDMYYEYACRRADELERLQDDLMERGLISEQDESDMDHSDR